MSRHEMMTADPRVKTGYFRKHTDGKWCVVFFGHEPEFGGDTFEAGVEKKDGTFKGVTISTKRIGGDSRTHLYAII